MSIIFVVVVVILVTKGARLLTRVSGLTLGAGLGYILFGDTATFLEEERQRHMRGYFWWCPVKTEDLTEKMWPELKELREKMWFQNMERRWSDLRDKMFSDRKS
ncbi:hypothetical protein N665_0819s0023 [Sinapis alba]|nr:hypothetical protein N665_0819s0023 [Sinapis alba]